jgi:hypothetical protein
MDAIHVCENQRDIQKQLPCHFQRFDIHMYSVLCLSYLLIPTSSEIDDFLEKFPLKRHLSLNVNLVSLNNHHIEISKVLEGNSVQNLVAVTKH